MLKIRLVDAGKHKIEVIKLVRLFTKLGLKEAKELVDNIPSILVSKNEDISIEQIKKNFLAIGAIVEDIKEEINPPANAAGIDDSQLKPERKTLVQIKKDINKNQTGSILYKTKLILKPAIIFALFAALVSAYFSVRLGYSTFYFVFIVGVGAAYFLRKSNIQVDKNLGIASAAITFLYFFASIVFNWIIYFVLYEYFMPVNPFRIFISLFSSLNIFVVLAAILSFVLASNKNIFKNLYNVKHSEKNSTKNIIEKKNIPDHKEKEKF